MFRQWFWSRSLIFWFPGRISTKHYSHYAVKGAEGNQFPRLHLWRPAAPVLSDQPASQRDVPLPHISSPTAVATPRPLLLASSSLCCLETGTILALELHLDIRSGVSGRCATSGRNGKSESPARRWNSLLHVLAAREQAEGPGHSQRKWWKRCWRGSIRGEVERL